MFPIFSRSWKNAWLLLAVALCPVVFFVSNHFIRSRHHPPVGVYIAIMGGVAAAVTFRKDPSVPEKAAWIFLITLLLVAEIRNLYVVDAEQSQTFREITSRLEAVGSSLKATSEQITTATHNAQEQFDVTMSRFREAIDTENGGNSFCYFELLWPEIPNGEMQGIVQVRGKYPLHDTWMRLVDIPKFRQFLTNNNPTFRQALNVGNLRDLGDLPANGQRPLLDISFDDTTEKFYGVQFGALNGSWKEIYRLKRIDGKWREAIKVTDVVHPGNKVMFEHIDPLYPRIGGRVDWEH